MCFHQTPTNMATPWSARTSLIFLNLNNVAFGFFEIKIRYGGLFITFYIKYIFVFEVSSNIFEALDLGIKKKSKNL